jgi:hypothetical protein
MKHLVLMCVILSSLIPNAASAATTPSAPAAAAPAYGTNLIENGDAEGNLGASNATDIVKPSGWETTGQFTAVQYGAAGEFPDISTNGPASRELNLFEGGNAPISTATQTIALTPYATDIDAGKLKYVLSGWLGGWQSREDNATVTVTFIATHGTKLTSDAIGPVTAQQRLFNSGYIEQEATNTVPKNARAAVIKIVLTRVGDGYNHGSLDNVSLVLNKS